MRYNLTFNEKQLLFLNSDRSRYQCSKGQLNFNPMDISKILGKNVQEMASRQIVINAVWCNSIKDYLYEVMKYEFNLFYLNIYVQTE